MLTIPEEIKTLIGQDSCRKNIRITFPNGERGDICNDLIVMDSVSLKESLCSQDEFKFGLCEAPIFECETVGVENIEGATIKVYCEIYCSQTVDGAEYRADLMDYVYPLNYGVFLVDSAERQSNMVHRKIVAYGNGTIRNGVNHYIEEWKMKLMILTSSTDYIPNAFNFYAICAGLNLSDCDLYDKTEVTSSGYDYYGSSETIDFFNVRYFTKRAVYSYPVSATTITGYSYDTDIEATYERMIDEIAAVDLDGRIIGRENAVKVIEEFKDAYDSRYVSLGYFVSFGMPIETTSYCFYAYRGNYDSPATLTMRIPAGGQFILQGNGVTRTVEIDGLTTNRKVYSYTIKDDYPVLQNLTVTIPKIKKTSTTYGPDYDYENADNRTYLDAVAELAGRFGYSSRDGIFNLINIRQKFGLNPSGTLYPNSNLYPQGVTGGKLLPEDYQSCWYSDYYTLPYGAIQCNYTDSNNDEYLYIYYLTGYSSSTDITTYKVYDLSDNKIIQDYTWAESDIESFCQQIASNIEGVTYMPVDFVGRGLPYVEVGDTFEILTPSSDSITTIVLDRTIKGEQVLTDNYSSVK